MSKEYRSVARTRRWIKESLVELLGEKKDIDKITVAELAERADISKSTFYYHYNDIYAVIEEFQRELIDKLNEVIDAVDVNTVVNYRIYIQTIIEFLKSHEAIYSKVIRSHSTQFFIDKQKTLLANKVFERDIFHFSDDPNIRLTQIRFFANACVDTIADYFKGILNVSLDEIGEIIIKSLERLTKS